LLLHMKISPGSEGKPRSTYTPHANYLAICV
jgi:hypothetical protein